MVFNGVLTFTGILSLSSLVFGQRLNKPALRQDLGYLHKGLMDNLQSTPNNNTQWEPGWIPADCKSMAEAASLNPADVATYNVSYVDCGDPWILCRHKDSPIPPSNLIDLFGRLPVSMRQWVRHIITLPHPEGISAYNQGGNIAMFNNADVISLFIHEAAHSIDGLGATPANFLSRSDIWISSYNQDRAVPDLYARTNQAENVAQNTVVAVFDVVVKGGLPTVEPKWDAIHHQCTTVKTQAGSIITPGGRCTRRLENSSPVQQSASSRIKRSGGMPDVSLSGNVEVIPPRDFYMGECHGF